MADETNDILQQILDSYNRSNDSQQYKTNLDKAYGYFANEGPVRADIDNHYTKQLETFEKLSLLEKKHKNEMTKWSIQQHKYEQEATQSLNKTILNDLKDRYKFEHDETAKNYDLLNQREAEIYRSALDSGEKLNKEQLKKLKEIEKERLKLEDTIEKRQQKTIEKWKQGTETVIKALMQDLNKFIDLMWTDNIKNGLTKVASAYEENFTTIAGYTGSDSRKENHNLIKETLQDVNSNDYTKHGLKFSEDVFPALTEAVKQGFMGDEAQDVAISNAIDKKIMPWLETSSETWVQLQYDLSTDRLQQIKGQQLLLQETREGNRLLQSGVISQLQDALLPSIDNIVANTTEVDDLNKDMQKQYLYLTEDMGYSKQEAMKYIQQEIDAYQNPYKSITSGDDATRMKALDHLYGTNLAGNFMNMMIGSGWVGAGVSAEKGFQMGGETNSERGIIANATVREGSEKYADVVGDGLTAEEFERIYKKGLKNLTEDVTATYDHDAGVENSSAELYIDTNLAPHGADTAALILDEVIAIKNWLMNKASDFLSNFLGEIVGNIAGRSVGSSSEGGILGSQSAQTGLLGLLNKGGANLTGAAAGSTKATIAGGLGIAGITAGVAMTGYGIKAANDEFSQIGAIGNTEEEDKHHSVSGSLATTGAVAGAVGATSITAGMLGAGAAAGPIGWAALAIGGIALLGKAAYDNATALSGNAKMVENSFNSIRDTLREENAERIEAIGKLKEDVETSQTFQEDLQALRESGLISEDNIRKLNQDSLNDLTEAYANSTVEVSAMINTLTGAAEIENKTEQDEQQKEFLYDLQDKLDSHNGGDTLNATDQAIIDTLMAGVTDEELLKKYKTHMASGGKMTYDEAVDIVNGGSDNWFDKNNMLDKEIDVETMAAVNSIYDISDTDFEVFDPELHSAITKKIVNAASEYEAWKKASNKDSKDMILTKIQDVFKELHENKEYTEVIKNTNTYKQQLNQIALATGLEQFSLGSAFIPTDMLALLHTGERILTANQNKEYTEQLVSGNQNIIQVGLQDVVAAIKQQTNDIITYLKELSFNNNLSSSSLNMSPVMGNTKVVY